MHKFPSLQEKTITLANIRISCGTMWIVKLINWIIWNFLVLITWIVVLGS